MEEWRVVVGDYGALFGEAVRPKRVAGGEGKLSVAGCVHDEQRYGRMIIVIVVCKHHMWIALGMASTSIVQAVSASDSAW